MTRCSPRRGRRTGEGWQPELTADGGILRFALSDSTGNPLSALSVSAHVGRPSTTREDRSIEFAALVGGSYEARDALPPGLWEVDLEARQLDEIVFRRTQEVYVKPIGPSP